MGCKAAPNLNPTSFLKPDRAQLRPFQLLQFLDHLRPGPVQGQAPAQAPQAPCLAVQHVYTRVVDEIHLPRINHHMRALAQLQTYLQVVRRAKEDRATYPQHIRFTFAALLHPWP